LPETFARELTAIITRLDPTTGRDRITTTCNGGKGSHWNVPQDWTGTYGGNCNDYDLTKHQLVGEYGTWRHIGAHTEAIYTGDENDRSESYCNYLHEVKIRRAETVRDQAIGHYHWILSSFPNPGRSPEAQEGTGNHAIGPINHKGLFTAWRQPVDLYYLFRANYVDPRQDPMVYIVSHTWPDRFSDPTDDATIQIFSNCDHVELFNGPRSLGRLENPGRGYHFRWEHAAVQESLLHAKGYVDGVEAAQDALLLNNLPTSNLDAFHAQTRDLLASDDSAPEALFRINCGALEDYTDHHGSIWQADVNQENAAWRSSSWGDAYPDVADDAASRSTSMEPVRGCGNDDALFHTHRYGREALRYTFDVPAGSYRLELYFSESWYGIGGGDCAGWRIFDVAVNDHVVIQDLDIWREVGANCVLKKSVQIDLKTPGLTLHFPKISVNQATISAIALHRLSRI
jgi:hypothetical protein